MPDPSSSTGSHDPKKELLDAQVALDQGDYRTVRKKLRSLTDPSIRIPADIADEVAKLERSVKSDPAALILAAGCLVFFVIVLSQYVL